MVTIILPGYSVKNKEWLEETAKEINAAPDSIGVNEIRPIYWDHWADPQAPFDKEEKARLIDGVIGKRSVNIIAKSIGTYVAGLVIQRSPQKINKVILNGICLNDLNADEKELLESNLKLVSPEKILCIQNENDPHGSFTQAKEFLLQVNPKIVIISKPRADHEYFYVDEFNKFLPED